MVPVSSDFSPFSSGASGTPSVKLHAPDVALAAHLGLHADRQRVDHGDADAVQAAGDRVPAAAELSAGVQDGHDDLDGGLVLLLVQVDGDAAAVVDDPDARRPCGS